MIYLAVIIALLVLCYVYDYRGREEGRLLWWIVIMVVLICIAGFRFRMGTDSIKYENYYNWDQPTLSQLRPDHFQATRFAPLYIVLASACRSISSDFLAVQFAVSIIVNISIFRFLWCNTRHIFFAALLYFFFQFFNLNMEVLREALAVSVFLWAWPLFLKGKWLAYYALAVLAFFFHVSSIFMFLLPLFWLPGPRWIFTFGPRTLIVAPLVLLSSFAISYYFFDFIQMLAITENISERAEVYSKTELSGNNLNIAGAIGMLTVYAIYPLFAMYLNRKRHETLDISPDNESRKLDMMTLMSVYIALFTVGISIFLRFNNYFVFFSFITISRCMFRPVAMTGRFIRFNFLYWMLFILPLFALQFRNSYLADYNRSGTLKVYMMYYPYTDTFTREPDHNRERVIQYSRKL